MQKRVKPELRVLQDNRVQGVTCFAVHEKYGVDCQFKTCAHWLPGLQHNCTIIAAKAGEQTQHEIGKLFGLTRMRICQIEKRINDLIRQAADSSAAA